MDAELESQLASHGEQLQLLSAELDRQRTSYTARVSASNSRAALLIGTASIAAGFQATATTSPWQVTSVSFTVAAAILGVIAMWPRSGNELNIDPMVNVMYTYGPRETEWNLLNHKLHVHGLDERALKFRRWFLLVGFSFLALSILFTGFRITGVPFADFAHTWPAVQSPPHPGR